MKGAAAMGAGAVMVALVLVWAEARKPSGAPSRSGDPASPYHLPVGNGNADPYGVGPLSPSGARLTGGP